MSKPRNPPDGLMNYRQYADKRNVSLEAVRQAVMSGRIDIVKVGRHKYINPEDADKKWEANTDAAMAGNNSGEKDGGVTYQKARAVREGYQAKLARLEYEEKSGRLIDAEQVKRDAFELSRRVRDSILNIPSRVASQVISLTDPIEAEELLTQELRKALQALSDE